MANLRNLLVAALAAALAPACSSAKSTTQSTVASSDANPTEGDTAPALDPMVGWTRATMATSMPHGHRVANLVVSPSGTAAATIDAAQRVRLWPALDGSVEPIDPGLEAINNVELARVGKKLIVATLDSVGSATIMSLGADRVVRELHATGPSSPSLDIAVLPVSGATVILASDRSIALHGPDGAEMARYDHRGFKPLRLFVAGPKLIGALEAELGSGEVSLTLHLLRVELGPAPSLKKVGEAHELVVKGSIQDLDMSALSPAAKRFAISIIDPGKNESKVVIFDLADGSHREVSFGLNLQHVGSRIGFIDANHIVAAFHANSGTWKIDARTAESVAMPVWVNPAQLPRAVAHGKIVGVFGVGLHVYDTETRAARFMTYRSFFPGQGAVSPSGTKFLYHSGKDLYLFDGETSELRTRKLESETFTVRQSAFVDEDTLLFVSHLGAVELIDRASGKELARSSSGGGVVRVEYDPVGQRLIIMPRYGETWMFEVVDRTLKGPYIVNDGANRLGFFSGENALWTIDGANVIRTYTMGELRKGVSRASATGRGKRTMNVHPLALTRNGDILLSYYQGGQRFGRISIGSLAELGADSLSEKEPPLHASRGITVDFKKITQSAPISTSQAFVSPDGRKIAVAAPASLNIYDAVTFKLKWSYPTPQSVQQVSWDKRSSIVGVQSGGGIGFFDVESGKLAHVSCGPIFVTSDNDPPPTVDAFTGSICTAAQ